VDALFQDVKLLSFCHEDARKFTFPVGKFKQQHRWPMSQCFKKKKKQHKSKNTPIKTNPDLYVFKINDFFH
jgi:hypothetical protein